MVRAIRAEPPAGGGEPLFHLLQSGDTEMRHRLEAGGTTGFPIIDQLQKEGQTDYIAIVNRFDPDNAIGEMDCFYSRWTTTHPGGFADADLAALRRLVLAWTGCQIGVAGVDRLSLVEAYLGRDAGRRACRAG